MQDLNALQERGRKPRKKLLNMASKNLDLNDEVMYLPTTVPMEDGSTPKLYLPSTYFADGKQKKFAGRFSGRALLCLSTSCLVLAAGLALLCVLLMREVPGEVDRQRMEIEKLEREVEGGLRPMPPKSGAPGEGPGESCRLPKDPGPCFASVPRWFYNAGKGQCDQFVYGGCQGNGNNFVTLHECQMGCEDVLVRAGDVANPRNAVVGDGGEEEDPCRVAPDAGPCLEQLPRYFFDRSDSACKKFLYGGCAGNTNNFLTEGECAARCGPADKAAPPSSSKPDLCRLPADTGMCRALIERWYHHDESGECRLFNWGGCGGNDNNFSSREKCESYCNREEANPPSPRQADDNDAAPDACLLPAEAGPCEAAMERFHYDAGTGACRQFVFGGCLGNANNFDDLAACQEACGGVAKEEDVCSLPSRVGLCRAAMPRFFYNGAAGGCEEFIYGGCDGNGNNFLTLEECEGRCVKKT